MEINSDFIRKKEFHIVFKGYNAEEVDKFLDILTVEFDRLIKKNKELQESLDRLKFESTVEDDTDIKKIIQNALISAHKVAEEIKSQARKEAEEFLEKQKLEIEKVIENLKMKKLQLEQDIIYLKSKHDELKAKINKAIEDLSAFLQSQEINIEIDQKEEEKELTEKVNTEGESFEKEELEQEISTDEDSSKTLAEEEKIIEADNINEISNETENQVDKDNRYYFDKDISEKEKINRYTQEFDSTKNEDRAEKSADSLKDDEIKKEKKKIDIANPEIIEDFFRTIDD